MELQKARTGKAILRKDNKVRDVIVPDIKLNYKVIVIKQYGSGI